MFKAKLKLPLLHVANLTLLLLGISIVAWHYQQQILQFLITRWTLNENPGFDNGLAGWHLSRLSMRGSSGTSAFEVEVVEEDGAPPPAIRVRSSSSSYGALSLYQSVNLRPLDLTSSLLTRIVLEASVKRDSEHGPVVARVTDLAGNVLYDHLLLEQSDGPRGWSVFHIDITPKTWSYAGQTIKLYLTLHDLSPTEAAAWVIDNVAVSSISIQNLVALVLVVAVAVIVLIATSWRIKVGV